MISNSILIEVKYIKEIQSNLSTQLVHEPTSRYVREYAVCHFKKLEDQKAQIYELLGHTNGQSSRKHHITFPEDPSTGAQK